MGFVFWFLTNTEKQSCHTGKNQTLTNIIKTFKTTVDKLKHCFQHIFLNVSCNAHNVPDSSSIQTKTEDSQVYLSRNLHLNLDKVGGLSDSASALQEGLRYVCDSFDSVTNTVCVYISFFEEVCLQKTPSDQNKHAKPWLPKELQILWNIKEHAHKKGIIDE